MVSVGVLALCVVAACTPGERSKGKMANVADGARPGATATASYEKPPAAELKKRLSPIQYSVTQESGTEPPFDNEYWDHHGTGLYVDVVTGEPLFSSKDKFESGTGWPSFVKPLEPERVVENRDEELGMVRTEVRSRAGDSHLGHVFDDGPEPSGLRYCINSAALRFVAVDDLEAGGYGAYLPRFGRAAPPVTSESEVAILAGGCFWGMQELLRKIPGVTETEVGYVAGAEAVRIVFDPAKLSYADLLDKWFFRMHDPTTKNRQGNDTGESYRSAIFTTSEAQMKTATEVKARVGASGRWKKPIVTEISAAGAGAGGGEWKAAEEDHQDYLQKHPDGYTCHYLRDDTL